MLKTNKKGIVPIVLIAIILIIVAVAIAPNPFKLAILNNIEFAGLTFITANSVPIGGGVSGSSNIRLDGEYLILESSVNGLTSPNSGESRAAMSVDVTGIDELLIIYDITAYASAGAQSGAASGMSMTIKGTQNGELSVGGGGVGVGSDEGGKTKSQYFPPKVTKLKNNFDGTWSALESLNVGDIFIVKQKTTIQGNPILTLSVNSGTGGMNGGSSNIKATFYNIVRKENSFALCKADKYPYDINKDGIIAPDGSECLTLESIVLNSEEAIKESYDEKLARIESELLAKNEGLTADIEFLKQQLSQQQSATETQLLQQQLNQLQDELKTTKEILADVQAKDRNVISVIESQEQFKKPSFIKELWNKIIAWLKSLF